MTNSSAKSVIEDLLENPFSTRTLTEKLLICLNGRPCPSVPNLKSAHKDSKSEYTRSFKEKQYSLYAWLAGCENKSKLYCWPCLLFSDQINTWNSTGVDNLNALYTLQKKHRTSAAHLKSVIMLANFSEISVESLSTQARSLNSEHNLKVKKNRQILKRLIDVACFLANQELPFRGQDESNESLNRGNYVEIVELLKEYDVALMQHWETATVFKDDLAIQNDLIKAIRDVLQDHICKQIEQSELVAVMLEETSDREMKSQLSVVLRYYLKRNIFESFVGFIDISTCKSPDDLFEMVEDVINKYSIKNKIIAQSYGGAGILSGHAKDLHLKIKRICPNADFVHCYAHTLNSVLSQGLYNIRECKMFFSTLNGIGTFASHSRQRSYNLEEYLKRRFPFENLCFNRQLVNIVHTHRESVIQYFEIIETDDNDMWEANDRTAATGYVKFLESFKTVFLLNTFSKIFARSEALSNNLQSEDIDINECVNQRNVFCDFLKFQREELFLEIIQSTQATETYHEQRRKVPKEEFDSNETKPKKLFSEIIDNIILQMFKRYTSCDKLKYFNLLTVKYFKEYKTHLPAGLIKDLIDSLPGIFDKNALLTELSVLYEHSKEIQCTTPKTDPSEAQESLTPFNVLQWIESKKISETFEQVCRLAKLICTIPLKASSVQGTVSAFNRIETYLRNTRGQERLGDLIFLSVEKEMLADLRSNEDFYDRVIKQFLSLERRVDFIHGVYTHLEFTYK